MNGYIEQLKKLLKNCIKGNKSYFYFNKDLLNL